MIDTVTDEHGPDPVEEYVASLAAILRGPARAKNRMVQEIRDGLTDAADAHAGEGMPRRRAVREAVREFGTPEEIAPSCQRELTIAQARHTARVVALTVPCLLACWYLLRSGGPGDGWQPPRAVQMLAAQLAGVATGAALPAAATLAVTGVLARRLPTPHRLLVAVAWAGTTAAVVMGVAAMALAVASLLAADWPLVALAGVLAAASHAAVASSARACRQCVRLAPA
ncbi:permease prefix domain 1-containing protein [Actinomadura sp. NPDC047616]|uniref:permease prefix domain 1-containing protein n=1 Tax=Actinomadura sp. NPDC047616 TaxID=3155914 RepID=UPI0034085EDB